MTALLRGLLIGIGTSSPAGIPVREARFDLRFDRVGIKVPDHHQRRTLRAIIVAIEIRHQRYRCVADHLDFADWRSIGRELPLEQEMVLRFEGAVTWTGAQPLFGEHRSALGFE